MSQEYTSQLFKNKKCDNTRGQNSWKLNELKQMCTTLKIQFKNNENKAELCKKISKYFKSISTSPSSPDFPNSPSSPTVENLPLFSVDGKSILDTFNTKKCKDSRGPGSWTVSQLKEMCKVLKIPINSRMDKNDLCHEISKYTSTPTTSMPTTSTSTTSTSTTSMPTTSMPTTSMPTTSTPALKSHLTYKEKQIINAMNQKKESMGLVSIKDNTIKGLREQFIQNNCRTGNWSISKLKEICDTLDIKFSVKDDKSSLCFKIENVLFGGVKRIVDTSYLKNYNVNSVQKIFDTNECQTNIIPNKYSMEELKDISRILDIKVDGLSKNEMCVAIGNVIKTADVDALIYKIKKTDEETEEDLNSELTVDSEDDKALDFIINDLVSNTLSSVNENEKVSEQSVTNNTFKEQKKDMETYIIKYGQQSIEESRDDDEEDYYMRKIFDNVKTFSDLQECFVAYLQGRIGSNPTYGGSINTETIPLVENLVSINKNGFISVSGQPSSRERKDDNYLENRPHIIGFLEKKNLESFLKFIETQSNFYFIVINGKKDVEFDTLPSETLFVNRYIYDNGSIGSSYEIRTKTKKNPFNYFHEFPNIINMLEQTSVYVEIIGKEFNNGSTEDLLLMYFKEINEDNDELYEKVKDDEQSVTNNTFKEQKKDMETYIIKYGQQSIEESRDDDEEDYYMRKIFDNVKTFSDLQECFVAYLQGRIGSNPTYGGSINTETIPLVENLVSINKNGFISVSGQPSSRERKDDNYLENRPHIIGFLEKKNLESFLKFIETQSNFYFIVINGKKDVEFDTLPSETLFVNRYIYDNGSIGSSYEIRTKTKKNPFNYFHEFPNIINMLEQTSVYVEIIGKEFNNGSTEDLLLMYFKEINEDNDELYLDMSQLDIDDKKEEKSLMDSLMIEPVSIMENKPENLDKELEKIQSPKENKFFKDDDIVHIDTINLDDMFSDDDEDDLNQVGSATSITKDVINKIKKKVINHYKKWEHYDIYMLVTDYGTFIDVFDNFNKLIKQENNSAIEYYKDNLEDGIEIQDVYDYIEGNLVIPLNKNYYIDGNYNYRTTQSVGDRLISRSNYRQFLKK